MTTHDAKLRGYTREIIAECPEYTLYLLVKPDEDLDGTFTAWDHDEQEFLRLNGWLWSIEDCDVYSTEAA